ncbi:YdcF family protein [Lacticaseibacillus zhaodongensis]|uniref:YdcF family protein n=1 Tax=Lacticaseibacillus zhaodongensis TaxID=2668065 RepID=UPI0012D2D5D3|nr:YdcF family protein [Lacticaseibacillus zhaodongensis]
MDVANTDNFVIFLVALAAAATAVAIASYAIEPRRLLNGLLINLALGFDVIGGGALVIVSHESWLIIPAVVVFGIVMIAFLLLLTFHLVFLIWNAVLVWKRESHSLANMLTLLIAVALIIIYLFNIFGQRLLPARIARTIDILITLEGAYILLTLANFLMALIAYNLHRPWHRQDFLIVLGAGLIDGHKVSRLLGARVDRAIKYYRRQVSKGRKPPRIIFSGGQGPDEQLSEAKAMQQYAIQNGIPEVDTLLEDKSRTTLENMRFSAALIQQETKGAPYRAQFCTNNYHLFRAGLYARQAGLHANGLGAHTAPYFLPNATIREYVAILLLNKRRHIIWVSIIAAFALLTGLVA